MQDIFRIVFVAEIEGARGEHRPSALSRRLLEIHHRAFYWPQCFGKEM